MRELTKCFKITIIPVLLLIMITTHTQNLLSPYLLFWLRTPSVAENYILLIYYIYATTDTRCCG